MKHSVTKRRQLKIQLFIIGVVFFLVFLGLLVALFVALNQINGSSPSLVFCAELQESSFSSGGFDLELFIFVSMIIIVSLAVVATIVAICILVLIHIKRKRKIVIHYDEGKEESFNKSLTHDDGRTIA